MSRIRLSFVERKTSILPNVLPEWEVRFRNGYKIDLKMCQLRDLLFNFKWGDESTKPAETAPLQETPSKVIVLDVSLNELSTLDHEALIPLKELRYLDASLNRISRYTGIEVLKNLYHLNLAHNVINAAEACLAQCKKLRELNLSMNNISDISYFPSLNYLSTLYLNNNKLVSLDGIQALSNLKELYVQKNVLRDILPLASSLRLVVLNAADNHITSLRSTVEILRGLKKLQAVLLFGNPLDHETGYHQSIIEATTVMSLDNVSVKPRPSFNQDHTESYPTSSTFTVKDQTRQAFYNRLKEKKRTTDEHIQFLRSKIVALQDEYKEFEEKTMRDMDACTRYMDGLEYPEFKSSETKPARPKPDVFYREVPYRQEAERPYLDTQTQTSVKPPVRSPKPYEMPTARPLPSGGGSIDHDPYHGRRLEKGNYDGIKETDEVLRHAYNELVRQSENNSVEPPEY